MAIIQNLEAFVQSYPAGLDSVTDLQLSQNENGRQIRFTIGGVTIPAGSVATISGTKPDGVVYSNTGTIEGADTVIFDEDVQMTAVFGTWYAKIRITNAGNTIASARVRFIIDKDPVDAGAIPSESQLDGLVAEAEEYAEAAEDAAGRAAITYGSPLTASTAAAMTDVNRVYVYTGSESGYTYGNWYYYNGSAWVSGGIYNSAAVETDTTLTESGVPADAKATGDKIAELKDDLSDLTGNLIYEYTKDKSVSANAIPNQETESGWESVVVICQEGDVFCVKGKGGNSTKLWMFAKSDGTVIASSDAGFLANDFVTIVAPENAYYLCCNSKYTVNKGVLYKNNFVRQEIDSLNANIEQVSMVEQRQIAINIESGYKGSDNVDYTGYYHASFAVEKGEEYRIKAETGSGIRSYVLIANNIVVDYSPSDTWGTLHDYDVTYIVPQDGVLYINTISGDYIGLKQIVVVPSNQPEVDALLFTKDAVEDISTLKKSKNLYNGEYLMGYRATTSVSTSDTYCYTKPIALKAGTYLFTSSRNTFGGGGDCAYITDKNGQVFSSSDVITGDSVGTKTEYNKWNNRVILSFTLPNDSYVSFNIGRVTSWGTSDQVNNFMLTSGSTLNDIPHYEEYYQPVYAVREKYVNGLSGLFWKTAIFDGDSICRGDSVGASDPSYYDGYAGRIGKANYMTWKNYGIGGGCITSASNPSVGSSKHSVVDNVDTLYAQFPDADFIIFEGGTNDADLLGDAIANPTKLGSYTDNDYSGTYDATTFSGALETIFYKAIQYWKGKKIGFIVAHKMGAGYSKFDKDHANRRAYFERAIEICNKWGIPCLNLWDGCYLNPRNASCYNPDLDADGNRTQGYLYVDGQHLTAKGYDYISPIIEDWMKTL